ncbi:hypothetical protein CCOS865_00334 [Pseudomonas reidholzensis]|uniref:Uncharacterized protein n=1 Tax=Pseudomonas reidholzensis TaxID=1785162 RepID=A0A383RMY6_9PSED|nr:hypothetical protein [Pseudomonas reidholzensis]SYX88113.1 hypothetical protein CCOS865_00334 [Pseudomonas reidholzensis]
MGIRVDVLPLDVNTPGHGLLRITGWEGASEGLECSLQSSQTHDFLHPGGQWSNVAHGFKLDGLRPVDGAPAIETRIGPELIDPLLEASGTANFRVELSNPQLGQSDMGMVRINSAVLASSSAAPNQAPPAPAPQAPAPVPAPAPLPEPEPEPVASAPVIEPEPVAGLAAEPIAPAPAAKAKSGNRWLLPLLLVLALAAAAAGAWWWFSKKPEAVVEAPAPETTVEQPPTTDTPPAALPCTLESMQSQPEIAFVQACIQNAPGSAALLEVITQAKASNHCGVAQRLYANRAQGGDVEIASAYAREYDPKYHQPSECFKAPDAATAAYWYETILGFDENNAEAKQRFEELKP